MTVITEVSRRPLLPEDAVQEPIPVSDVEGPSLGFEEVSGTGRVWAAAAATIASLAVGVSILLSGKDLTQGPVVCPLRLTTGIPCPFCGMTTSFAEIGGLRISEAFLANPAGPLLFAAVVLGGILLVTAAVTGKRPVLRVGSARWLRPATLIALVSAVAMMWTAELFRFGIL